MVVTEDHIKLFHDDGYFVLEKVIPADVLVELQRECEKKLSLQMASMESVGANTLGLSHKEKRYTLPARPEDNPRIEEFLFGDLMKEIVGATLGANAYLLLELFSVKWPRTGTPFGWHQDSGYLLGNPHKPYLSLFCAVDNLTEENGCLHVLPYSRAESRSVVKHIKDRQTNDFVGYEGSDPGVALTVEAGGIIVMSSLTFHCSGTNLTDDSRRAFLISYSPEPITDAKGNLWNMAIPFLENGINVHQSATEVSERQRARNVTAQGNALGKRDLK